MHRETGEQLDFLRAQGCDDAQGFLLGKAICAEEMTRLLRDSKAAPATTLVESG